MTANFLDSNTVIYAFSENGDKAETAYSLLQDTMTVSTQVINETANTLSRKYGFSMADTDRVSLYLLELCQVTPVSTDTIRKAIALRTKYSLSHWDNLIVAAALLAGCQTLLSEDMQHGQVFDGALTVQDLV